jgi:enoyl-CoA hydratase/carnithine racemase
MPLPLFAIALAEDRLATTALVPATLGAQVYDPHGAAEIGYLDRVVAVESVAEEAIAEARRLGAYSSGAYAQTKEVLRAGTLRRVLEGGEADLARFTVEPPA